MANENDSFLRQINEEVRREKLSRLWEKYGVLVIGGLAAVLLAFGGWRFYQSETSKAARQAGAQFVEAGEFLGDQAKKDDALRALEKMAGSGPRGYALLSKLKLAAYARSQGKHDEAEKQYEAVANDRSAPDMFRSFAKLQIASLKLDTGSFTDVKNQLNAIIVEENPWRHSAREILGLAALKAGNYSEARETFQAILTAKDAPRTTAERAHIVMAMITREELKAAAGTESATPKSEPAGTAPGTSPASEKSGPDGTEPEKRDGASTPSNATPN